MDKNTMVVAICGMGMVVVLIGSVLNAIVRIRQSRRVAAAAPDDLRRIETRLADMQEALDAVAVEIERISEGQRFTTRLLSERGEIPAGAANDARGQVARSR